MDNIIDINKFPDQIYENYQKAFRTIGLGITGLADMLVMLNMKYNSKEAEFFVNDLMNYISLNTYKASIELAKEKGSFPFLDREKFINSGFIQKHIVYDKEWKEVADDIQKYGIRNAKMLSIAPTGTLSLTFGNNCSSGLEPIFSLEYDRKVKMGGQSENDVKIVKMRDNAYEHWLKVKDNINTIVTKDKFITALEMTVDEHVNMLGIIAFHVDMSCSKTINVPTDYEFEDTKKIYMRCHDLGIKGCTIFRPNEIRQGILISNSESKNEKKENTSEELGRGYIYTVCDDLISYKRTIQTGCGKMYLHLDFDEVSGEPFETWIDLGGSGGCERNLTFISRLISLALRGGIPLDEIIEQTKSIRPCIAYTNRTKKHGDTSPGTSCPSALGIALKELNEKIKDKCFDEIENQNTNDIKVGDILDTIINDSKKKLKCPDCGEDLIFEGGCNICKSCGWTKCS